MSHVHVYNACVLGLSHSGNDDITIVKTLMNNIIIPYNENNCVFLKLFSQIVLDPTLINHLRLFVFEFTLWKLDLTSYFQKFIQSKTSGYTVVGL